MPTYCYRLIEDSPCQYFVYIYRHDGQQYCLYTIFYRAGTTRQVEGYAQAVIDELVKQDQAAQAMQS
jgi:hypothetical protein